MLIFPLFPIQIVMSEMFDKSQMSESFDVPAGCLTLYDHVVGFSPPITKLGQGYIFTGVCDSVHMGGMRGCRGHSWQGGMHGCWGACMVGWGGVCGCWGHAWLAGGMHGCWGACMVAGGHVWLLGACVVAGGHAWLLGDMCVCGAACMVVGGHAWLLGGHAWDTTRYGQ